MTLPIIPDLEQITLADYASLTKEGKLSQVSLPLYIDAVSLAVLPHQLANAREKIDPKPNAIMIGTPYAADTPARHVQHDDEPGRTNIYPVVFYIKS